MESAIYETSSHEQTIYKFAVPKYDSGYLSFRKTYVRESFSLEKSSWDVQLCKFEGVRSVFHVIKSVRIAQNGRQFFWVCESVVRFVECEKIVEHSVFHRRKEDWLRDTILGVTGTCQLVCTFGPTLICRCGMNAHGSLYTCPASTIFADVLPQQGIPIITRPPLLTALVLRNDDSPLTAWCCIPGQEVVAHPAVDIVMFTDGAEKPPVGGNEKVCVR